MSKDSTTVDVPYKMKIMRIDRLEPHPKQAELREMSDDAWAGLSGSIDEYGLLEEPIYNRRTGHLLSGHQRVAALLSKGVDRVRVKVVDVEPATEDAIFVNMNNPEICGRFTDAAPAYLKTLRVELGDEAFQAVGLETLEVSLGGNGKKDGLTDPDDVPEVPEEPTSKPGDLYSCGDHRLLCGDATIVADVRMLLGKVVPLLMVTDPPYGVEYDPSWRTRVKYRDSALKMGGKGHTKRFGKVTNDDRVDWSEAWLLFPGDVVYVWHGGIYSAPVAEHLYDCGFHVRACIIWKKPSFVISRGHYHWQHEPCWYAVRDGKTASWIGDRKQSTIWEVGRQSDETATVHGTQKPVECMERPIRNHDALEVYDPFLGSGTTMIACEQLGRRCFGMEIEPRYVDVAVRRWEQFTGRKAKLLERA